MTVSALGLLTHAHDFTLVWASSPLRPQGVVDWSIVILGFFWTFAKWNLGGLLLWAVWNDPALRWYAIAGAAASMFVWGVLELWIDLAMTSETPDDRAFVWIYNVRKLMTYLWWGLGLGTALWLLLLVIAEK